MKGRFFSKDQTIVLNPLALSKSITIHVTDNTVGSSTFIAFIGFIEHISMYTSLWTGNL